MANLPKAQPTAALAELLERDGVLDDIISGRGLKFDSPPAPPVEPLQPFYIPEPDWHAEEAERLERERERERQERERILTEELERVAAEDEQVYPTAPVKKRRWPL